MSLPLRYVALATALATASVTRVAVQHAPRGDAGGHGIGSWLASVTSRTAGFGTTGAHDLVLALPVAHATSVATVESPDVAAGEKLFVAYNCGDCHGAGGSGAMGPSLQDNRWRFGGSAAEIARSISEGRPEGMPAWGPLIPASHVRQLVAYIQSLGAGKDVTTENFTGATVERAGH